MLFRHHRLSTIQSITLLAFTAFLHAESTFAATPLVEFLSKPASTQYVRPDNSNIIYYTLKNNTNLSLPLKITLSSALSIFSANDSCGTAIAAHSTCILPIKFTAPITAQTVAGTINIDYQGRAPLQDAITYRVDPDLACRLLEVAAYQSKFCQQQYQNVLQDTPHVFNPINDKVINGQTVGGMFGIYQHQSNIDNICYVSCGVKELNDIGPDENTMFELASVTKTFTGSILGKKVHLGLNPHTAVKPQLPIGTWLGESFSLNANEETVTFAQLATFSGGVCYSDAPNVVITHPTNQKQADFVKDINLLDPSSSTCLGNGSNVRPVYLDQLLPTHNFYSNSSVGLLGQVLMNIDGYTQMDQADFNGWMCQHILTPLGMSQTSACLPAEANGSTCTQTGSYCNTTAWASNVYATGYHIAGPNYQLGAPFPYVPWAAAGNLRSSAADMIKYIKANLGINDNNDPALADLIAGMTVAHTSNDYLPAVSSLVRANIGSQSPLVGGQGYGWVCDPSSSDVNAICGKIGGHTNFRSFVGFSKSKQYGVVILFNTGEASTDGGLKKGTSTIPSPSDIGVNLIKQAPVN